MKLEEAAGRAGLSTEDARALVDHGLVKPDPRTGEFDAWRATQLTVAKRAQDLGVPDDEIAGLMTFLTQEAIACAEIATQAEQQRAEIEKQLAEIKAASVRRNGVEGAA